ncbi:MAG: hypothetical protein WA389_14565, partial [Terriglobales bacterium]
MNYTDLSVREPPLRRKFHGVSVKDFVDIALSYLPFPWAWPTVAAILAIATLFFILKYRFQYQGERGIRLLSSRIFLSSFLL